MVVTRASNCASLISKVVDLSWFGGWSFVDHIIPFLAFPKTLTFIEYIWCMWLALF
jgi:hypothetical protein